MMHIYVYLHVACYCIERIRTEAHAALYSACFGVLNIIVDLFVQTSCACSALIIFLPYIFTEGETHYMFLQVAYIHSCINCSLCNL